MFVIFVELLSALKGNNSSKEPKKKIGYVQQAWDLGLWCLTPL
jgi:hypothetical protein